MSDTAKRIAELEKELAESINGYITRKVIKKNASICSGRKTASSKADISRPENWSRPEPWWSAAKVFKWN